MLHNVVSIREVAKSSPTVSASCALCETLADRESPTAVPLPCCRAPDISHLKSVYKMTSDAPQRPLKIKILGLKGEFTQTMTINVYSPSCHSKPVWLFPPVKNKNEMFGRMSGYVSRYMKLWYYYVTYKVIFNFTILPWKHHKSHSYAIFSQLPDSFRCYYSLKILPIHFHYLGVVAWM